MSDAQIPGDRGDREIAWVAHGRRDRPPHWLVRWERARRSVLLAGGMLVILALGPAFLASSAVTLRAVLTVGWLGLLLMIVALWQPGRLRHHVAWLTELRPPMDDEGRDSGCSVASCTCGWQSPPRERLSAAMADAAAHTPVLDPDIERSM